MSKENFFVNIFSSVQEALVFIRVEQVRGRMGRWAGNLFPFKNCHLWGPGGLKMTSKCHKCASLAIEGSGNGWNKVEQGWNKWGDVWAGGLGTFFHSEIAISGVQKGSEWSQNAINEGCAARPTPPRPGPQKNKSCPAPRKLANPAGRGGPGRGKVDLNPLKIWINNACQIYTLHDKQHVILEWWLEKDDYNHNYEYNTCFLLIIWYHDQFYN